KGPRATPTTRPTLSGRCNRRATGAGDHRSGDAARSDLQSKGGSTSARGEGRFVNAPSTATPHLSTVPVPGQIAVAPTDAGQRPLSAAKRQLLALLVAAGPHGADGDDLVAELSANRRPISHAALRMAVARLRDHLPPDALPESDHGVYRLRL